LPLPESFTPCKESELVYALAEKKAQYLLRRLWHFGAEPPFLLLKAVRASSKTVAKILLEKDKLKKVFLRGNKIYLLVGVVGGIVEGKCTSLVASTIVDLTSEDEIKLIREGPIPFAQLEEAWRN